jgi:glucose/arabinose dehydrogenase
MIRNALLITAVMIGCGGSDGATEGTVPPPPASGNGTFGLADIASGLSRPVYLTAAPGDARLFVVEKVGRIRIIKNGSLVATPFLDITSKVNSSGNEQGLLSVAFHPSYATNGFLYVNYTDASGDTRIERYTVSSNPDVANAASAKLVLGVDQPFANHNGGLNLFGPDGMLYIGLGDGGSAGDPQGNGQNKNALLGKLLRIDVDHGDPYTIPSTNPFVNGGGRGEVWAYGLRNPWRFSFDKTGNVLFIADVGQNAFEEVNAVAANRAGVNYGWNIMEAASCYNASSCNKTGLEQPVVSYNRDGGTCSVIGGMVYRGSAVPQLAGHFVYADYCAGWIKSFTWTNNALANPTEWQTSAHGNITSFGQDASGEMYILSENGHVYKIVKQ